MYPSLCGISEFLDICDRVFADDVKGFCAEIHASVLRMCACISVIGQLYGLAIVLD